MSSNDIQLQNDSIEMIEIIFDDELEDCGNHILTAEEFVKKFFLVLFDHLMEKIF